MSGLVIGAAGGAMDASEIHIGTGAGTAQVLEGWVGAADGNKQFFAAGGGGGEALSAVASPGSQSWGGSGFDRTANLSVEIAGGVAPYSIVWFGSGPDLTVIDGEAVAVAHSTSDAAASFYARVTDAGGAVAVSNTISVSA